MKQKCRKCRNCQSLNTVTLEQGIMAPFFLKRVYGITLKTVKENLISKIKNPPMSMKKKLASFLIKVLNSFNYGKKLLEYRGSVGVQIRVCKDCSFVGPEIKYEYEVLNGLYVDYRSESYNNDRITFEPFYAQLKDYVGKSEEEITSRLSHIDALINQYVDVVNIDNVIDWGGGEGKFIPSALQSKNVYVLDVSSEPLVNNQYSRVDSVPENVKFDYVQVCHVLEHVASPYEFMLDILTHINQNGYIYIEVPQDQTDETIQMFVGSNSNIIHSVHEHLNLFSVQSLNALAMALGLKILILEKKSINLGWTQGNIVSGLFIKQ